MKRLLVSAAAALLASLAFGSAPAAAQALKGAGTCNDEYKANKPALRAAKEKKGDFIAACRALPPGTPTPIAGAAPSDAVAGRSLVPKPADPR